MSKELVAQRVAAKCYFQELAASRALGCDGVSSYISAFRAMDSVYRSAFAPDLAYVWQDPKIIRGKGA